MSTLPNITNTDVVQVGFAVQTEPQPTPTADAATAGTVPATAAEEVMTTNSQSIAANEPDHAPVPSTADLATKDSVGTNVPTQFRFTETQYEPSDTVTIKGLCELSQDDLLTGLKKQYGKSRTSYGQFGRDLGALVKFYDAVVALCSCERVSKNRNGKPTLEQAFLAVGWNYEAARKMKQRYMASMTALPAYAATPKPPQLSSGDAVKAGNGAKGVVQNVHQSVDKADVLFEGREKTVTLPTCELKKVIVAVKKIKAGERLLDQDSGAEYIYEGNGKISRTKTPTLLEKHRERELTAIKAKQERENAKAEEKKRQADLRNAEAAHRDLEKIAAAKAKKGAAPKKKAGAAATKAIKQADKVNTKAANRKELVKVVRIGRTQEFGVFPDSCFECNTTTALTVGTQHMCEAERDRINAKWAGKVSELAAGTTAAVNLKQETAAVL
jgi:hypothetical protein